MPVSFSDYQVVALGNLNDFQQAIRDYGENGWLLYGDPFQDAAGHYCQAMIQPAA